MKSSYEFMRLCLALVVSLLFFTGCMKEEVAVPNDDQQIGERVFFNPSGTVPPSVPLYGLSADNRIVRLMSGPPATVVGSAGISGLGPGESILAIDIRPSTRELYGISSGSVLYKIDPMSGVSTPIGTKMSPELSGEMVGFDFEPGKDLITIVTNRGQHLRVDPETGTVALVADSLDQALMINSIAYLSKAVYDPSIRLLDINTADGRLYAQDPNTGVTTALGSTGLIITGEGGFDIARDNRAFAILNARTQNGINNSYVKGDNTAIAAIRLFNIEYRSGRATSLGPVANLIGIAVP